MLLNFPRLSGSLGHTNIIDFGYSPTTTAPVTPIKSAYAQFILLRNNLLDFNSPDNFNFVVGQVGGASTGSGTVNPNPYASFIILSRWNTLDFSSVDNFNFSVGVAGGSSSGTDSSGGLILLMTGESITVGNVLNFNDGVINVTTFPVNYVDPIVQACKGILKQVGAKARTYKLKVMRGSALLFTVRSIFWGSLVTINPPIGDYQAIDNQTLSTGNPPI